MTLSDRVLATIRTHRMIPAGGRVLVALSGGPDSVALTLILKDLEKRELLRVAGVAHVNHGLRDGAAGDEAFCRAFAEQVGVPFFIERADVREVARLQRRSLEDAGRIVRYSFFRRMLIESATDVVATGHTRDDQAETFLLRLIRGAGSRGLAGIYPVAGPVVRPLLDIRRQALRAYLSERDQPFCDDETNRDVAIPRNRVRHELIPYVEREFSPGIVEVLAREADQAREDELHLQKEAIESSGLIVLRSSRNDAVPLSPDRITSGPEDGWFEPGSPSLADEITAVEIDAGRLAALSQAVASRLARLALSILAPGRFVAYHHVKSVLALASAARGSVSLPGQQATRRGGRIVLVREPVKGFASSFCVPLSLPGEVILHSQGWAISAEVGSNPVGAVGEWPVVCERPLAAMVRADRLTLPLAVRSRRQGDRFQPPGLRGRHRKLQDVLVDRKVARDTRDLLPLVVDGDDRIVWIVGHAVGEDFRVTEPSQGVILLIARRLGGPG